MLKKEKYSSFLLKLWLLRTNILHIPKHINKSVDLQWSPNLQYIVITDITKTLYLYQENLYLAQGTKLNCHTKRRKVT